MIIKPNTFIIGAQKAATTSLYNWISQHPEVCGPNSLKDYPYFLLDNINDEKELDKFNKEYIDGGFNNQIIVLHGSVQYMFEPSAIKTIHNYDPNAKLICVLRNPKDRAISAYNYFKKLNIETRPFDEAIKKEKISLNGTTQERHDFTYVAHGLYAKQLLNVLERFKRDQLLVLFYQDIVSNPEIVVKKAYDFLGIDQSFSPQFNHLNSTGKIRFKLLQNLMFNDNPIKKFVVDKLIDPFLPLHKRTKIRLAFAEWNTKGGVNPKKAEDNLNKKSILNGYFDEDIMELENLLKVDLSSWKN